MLYMYIYFVLNEIVDHLIGITDRLTQKFYSLPSYKLTACQSYTEVLHELRRVIKMTYIRISCLFGFWMAC